MYNMDIQNRCTELMYKSTESMYGIDVQNQCTKLTYLTFKIAVQNRRPQSTSTIAVQNRRTKSTYKIVVQKGVCVFLDFSHKLSVDVRW